MSKSKIYLPCINIRTLMYPSQISHTTKELGFCAPCCPARCAFPALALGGIPAGRLDDGGIPAFLPETPLGKGVIDIDGEGPPLREFDDLFARP
jgi:hypothetical protein